MSGGIYGGDEIGAVVFDFGSNSIRAGFAGEDTPKADLPASIGVLHEASAVDTDDSVKKISKTKYYIGTNKVKLPIADMTVTNLIKDGMIENWELFEKALDHLYTFSIQSQSAYHPVVMSEAAWNTRSNREKLTELLFEKYSIPAFFLVKGPVLAAFAHGRTSGVVLDSGAELTSAVPVHDGYVLKNAIIRSPLAGDFISRQCKDYFTNSGIDLVPLYSVASKEAVSEGSEPIWKKKSNVARVTPSYHEFMLKDLIQDFTASVLQVNTESTYDKDSISQMPRVSYDFPNGCNASFGEERFRISEGLFDSNMIISSECIKSLTSANVNVTSSTLTMCEAVQKAVSLCDIDIRASLFGNVIVTGGNSLILGFTERLNKDLGSRVASNVKLKVVSNSGTAERRFSTWVGGSILGSLGSFHQLWISKQEFEETGKSIVEKKCP